MTWSTLTIVDDSTCDAPGGGGEPLASRDMGVGTLEELRAFWVETGNRKRLTKALIPRIAPLRGRVLDVGGGRDAPHDVAWSTAAKRIRLDLVATHRP